MATESTKKEQLLHEAETWIVKLRSGHEDTEVQRAFSDWLNTSYDHVRAFDQAYETWETLGVMTEHAEEYLTTDLPQKTSNGFLARLLLWRPFSTPWSGAALATCASLIIAVVAFYPANPDLPKNPVIEYASVAGELRKVVLPDGSMVELNTRSRMETRFSAQSREITLLAGEAYFSVAKDKDRPFIVNFGRGAATALGTQFNIHRGEDTTAVTVTEGLVAVSEMADLADPTPSAVNVGANQQIKVGRRGLGAVKNLDPKNALAWRDKTLVFDNTPLVLALEEVNRYLTHPIDLTHDDLSELRVSGVFSVDRPEETAAAIIDAFQLEHIRTPPENSLYAQDE